MKIDAIAAHEFSVARNRVSTQPAQLTKPTIRFPFFHPTNLATDEFATRSDRSFAGRLCLPSLAINLHSNLFASRESAKYSS